MGSPPSQSWTVTDGPSFRIKRQGDEAKAEMSERQRLLINNSRAG